MILSSDPSFTGANVQVDFDLGTNTITARLPRNSLDGHQLAAHAILMTPAEAVELAGGITAAGVSAAAHLLAQRTAAAAGPVERVTDAGTAL